MSIERQSSDFALGDRQESVLEPGFVRAPRNMKPPTPVEWGRGDSSLFIQENTTPLMGYGREKDPFSDAINAISPTNNVMSGFPPGSGVGMQQQDLHRTAAPPAALDNQGPRLSVFGQPMGVHHSMPPQQQQPQAHPDIEVGFGGDGLPRQSTSDELLNQFRTPSQQHTDDLWRCSVFFPPPAPIMAPGEQRRARAELWFYHASKWDITHSTPPPPRSPLPFMDEEKTMPPSQVLRNRYPYRGDYWLGRCEHWFNHVVRHFAYPARQQPQSLAPIDPQFVLQEIA